VDRRAEISQMLLVHPNSCIAVPFHVHPSRNGEPPRKVFLVGVRRAGFGGGTYPVTPTCQLIALFSDIPLRTVRDFNPDSLLDKVVSPVPQSIMHTITKARHALDQIRPDERTNLITVPAQTNLVLWKDPTPIPALFQDSQIVAYVIKELRAKAIWCFMAPSPTTPIPARSCGSPMQWAAA
jgi:hypothetical protein